MRAGVDPVLDPEKKVEVLQHSRLSYVYGLLGLIPVLGVPFIIWGLVHARRAKVKSGRWQNPAQAYVRMSRLLIPLATLVNLIVCLLVYQIYTFSGLDGNESGGGG